MSAKRSLKTTAVYEGFSLRHEFGLLAVVFVTPALVLLILNWLLTYILDSNLIASEVEMPIYFPLENINLLAADRSTSDSEIGPVLFYYSPSTLKTDRIAFEIINTLVTYNRELLANRKIVDKNNFYATLTEAHYPLFYRSFNSNDELNRYSSLPLFYSTNCTYKDYNATTIDDFLTQHASLGCQGTMVLTPDTYIRYNITPEYVENHPPETFRPAIFSLDFSYLDTNSTVSMRYNNTAFAGLRDPLTEYIAKDFYSTTGLVFYLAVQRAMYLESLIDDHKTQMHLQGDTDSIYKLPLLTSVPVPERVIPQIYPSQSGAFIMVLASISLNIVSITFAARDRGKGHSTLRLLGVSEGAYWLVRWSTTTLVTFISAVILVVTGYFSHILPLAGFSFGFQLLLALLLTISATGFSLFLSALFGRNGIIVPLIVSLLIGILCGAVVTAIFRLTYNTGSVFDTTIMPSTLTWMLTLLFPTFTFQNLLDFMMLVLHDTLRGKTAIITRDSRRNPTRLLSCGMRCYTDPTYGNSVYKSELIGAKQLNLGSSTDNPILKTYSVPPASVFCVILGVQFIFYSLMALTLGYSLSEPMYRGINLMKVLYHWMRYRRKKKMRHKATVSAFGSTIMPPGNEKESQISLVCTSLNIVYGRGKRKLVAVDNFSFIAEKKTIVALLGTNGAGKSSVMAVFAGEKKPQQSLDPILVNDHDIRYDYEMLKVRSNIGKCPQHNQNVFESLTVAENMYLCALQRGALEDRNSLQQLLSEANSMTTKITINSTFPEDDVIENIRAPETHNRMTIFFKYAAKLNLESSALKKKANMLSGGMKRRLSLFNATIGLRNGVVFMDEVSTGLDPLTCKSLHNYIRDVTRVMGNTVILTTHNMADVEALADHIVVMKHGLTMAKGTIDEICSSINCFNVTLYAESVAPQHPGPVIAHPEFLHQCEEICTKLATFLEQKTGVHNSISTLLSSRTLYTFRLRGALAMQLSKFSTYLMELLDIYFAISSFTLESATLDDVFLELAADNDATEYSTSTPMVLYRSNARHIYQRVPYSNSHKKITIEDLREDDVRNCSSSKSPWFQKVATGLRRMLILERRVLRFNFFPSILIYLLAAVLVVIISKGLSKSLDSFVTSSMDVLLNKEKTQTLMECIPCCDSLFRDIVISQLINSGNEALANNDTYVDGAVFLACAASRPAACFSDSTESFYMPSSCQSFLMLQGWDVMVPRIRTTGPDALTPYFTNNEVPYYLIGTNDPTSASIPRGTVRQNNISLSTYSTLSFECQEFLDVCLHGCRMAASLTSAQSETNYNITLCQQSCNAIGYGMDYLPKMANASTDKYFGVCGSTKLHSGVVLNMSLRVEDIFLSSLNLQKIVPQLNYLDFYQMASSSVTSEELNRAYYKFLTYEQFSQMGPFLFFNWINNTLKIYGAVPDIMSADYSYSSIEAQVRMPYALSTDINMYSLALADASPGTDRFLQLANITVSPSTEYIRMRGYNTKRDFTSILSSSLPTRYLPEPVNTYTEVISLFLDSYFKMQGTLRFESSSQLSRPSITIQAFPYIPDMTQKSFATQVISSISYLLLPPVFMAPILYVSMSILKEMESKLTTILALHLLSRELQIFTIVFYYLVASICATILAMIMGYILGLEPFRDSLGYTASMLIGLSYSSAVLGVLIARLISNQKVASFSACCFILICFLVSIFVTDINPVSIIIMPLYFLVLLQKNSVLQNLSGNWIDFLVGFFITTAQFIVILNKVWNNYSDGIVKSTHTNTRVPSSHVSTALDPLLQQALLTKGLMPQHGLCEHVSVYPVLSIESLIQAKDVNDIKLHVAQLSHHYGKQQVLDCVGLDIRNGEISGLVGLSGSGKTTLINCLSNIIVPETGVAILQHSTGSTDLFTHENRSDGTHRVVKPQAPLSLMPQEDLLYPDLTVLDHLRLFAPIYGYSHRGVYVNGLLTGLSLFAHRHKRIRELSGGMRRRVSLILALIGCRHILCLDEFTTGLSINIKRAVWQSVLAVITDMKLSVILTSHDMHELEFFCMNVSVLHKGGIIYSGKTHKMGPENANLSQHQKHNSITPNCIVQLRCPEDEGAHILYLFFQEFGKKVRGSELSTKDASNVNGSKSEMVLIRVHISLENPQTLINILDFINLSLSEYKWLIGISKLETRFLRTISSNVAHRPTIKQICDTDLHSD